MISTLPVFTPLLRKICFSTPLSIYVLKYLKQWITYARKKRLNELPRQSIYYIRGKKKKKLWDNAGVPVTYFSVDNEYPLLLQTIQVT